ncbi:MAG TPA: DNA mismatch repair endonuclease MutL, partial [bacterium]|nr:DNA mismatch repair endonuclease MutL [bacterium]
MGRIHVLPDAVINHIAAGEVVERPASVVKELVENALDAGATQITVTLQNGGRDVISVLDNGSGMEQQDALLAVQRHATSKLRAPEDLERIATLGFRGEALASIAAVSRLELVTGSGGPGAGFRLEMEGGRLGATGGQGFPRGTRVSVADLFFNTPARRKFLRAPATELQHIQAQLAQSALAHRQVQFRVQHNGKPLCSWNACARLGERVHQVLGPEVYTGMCHVEG